MATKFGFGQKNKPTPQRIAILFDVLAGACGIIAGFVTSAAFISHTVSDIVSSLLTSLFIPLLLLFKRFFGVDIQEGTKIDVEDVAVIEEPKN